jgi:hypothetical protein
MKKDIFCILKITEGFGADPDPLVRGTDLMIRIPTKMSRIRNAVSMVLKKTSFGNPEPDPHIFGHPGSGFAQKCHGSPTLEET